MKNSNFNWGSYCILRVGDFPVRQSIDFQGLPHVNKIVVKYEELECQLGMLCILRVGDFSIREFIDVRGLPHFNGVFAKYKETEFQLGIALISSLYYACKVFRQESVVLSLLNSSQLAKTKRTQNAVCCKRRASEFVRRCSAPLGCNTSLTWPVPLALAWSRRLLTYLLSPTLQLSLRARLPFFQDFAYERLWGVPCAVLAALSPQGQKDSGAALSLDTP